MSILLPFRHYISDEVHLPMNIPVFHHLCLDKPTLRSPIEDLRPILHPPDPSNQPLPFHRTSAQPTAALSVCLCPSVSVPLSLSVCLSVCLYVSLSLSLSLS